jgi:hypothetical protein
MITAQILHFAEVVLQMLFLPQLVFPHSMILRLSIMYLIQIQFTNIKGKIYF